MTAKARKEFYETESNWKEMPWDGNPFFRYRTLTFKKLCFISLEAKERVQDWRAWYDRRETLYESSWHVVAIYKHNTEDNTVNRVSKTEALEFMKEEDK